MITFRNVRQIAGLIGVALALAGCMDTTSGTSTARPVGGGDGPVFVRDENGCRYEVILGQRFPIVDARGRQQCSDF